MGAWNSNAARFRAVVALRSLRIAVDRRCLGMASTPQNPGNSGASQRGDKADHGGRPCLGGGGQNQFCWSAARQCSEVSHQVRTPGSDRGESPQFACSKTTGIGARYSTGDDVAIQGCSGAAKDADHVGGGDYGRVISGIYGGDGHRGLLQNDLDGYDDGTDKVCL